MLLMRKMLKWLVAPFPLLRTIVLFWLCILLLSWLNRYVSVENYSILCAFLWHKMPGHHNEMPVAYKHRNALYVQFFPVLVCEYCQSSLGLCGFALLVVLL